MFKINYLSKERAACATIICLLLINNAFAQSKVYQLDADDWARPRSGEVLTAFPELKLLMTDWNRQPESVIELYYPGGDMGSLWASELRDWLVALGVPSNDIALLPGSATIGKVEIRLVKKRMMHE